MSCRFAYLLAEPSVLPPPPPPLFILRQSIQKIFPFDQHLLLNILAIYLQVGSRHQQITSSTQCKYAKDGFEARLACNLSVSPEYPLHLHLHMHTMVRTSTCRVLINISTEALLASAHIGLRSASSFWHACTCILQVPLANCTRTVWSRAVLVAANKRPWKASRTALCLRQDVHTHIDSSLFPCP